MATSAQGLSLHEYDFVEEPAEKFFCPITQELLLEPHQTLCCGRRFSEETVSRLKRDGMPCPMCRQQPLKTIPDRSFQRDAKELRIYCPNKTLGCKWVGEVGDLEGHLTNCKYPHVACEFSDAGCQARIQRHHMQTHVSENVTKHLSLVACDLKREKKKRSELQQRVEVQDAQLKDLAQQLKCQQNTVKVLLHVLGAIPHGEPLPPIFIPPPVFTVTEFEKHKRDGTQSVSPPFSSHIGGYKMCLIIKINGQGSGKGTHVSVHVHMMRGEYDDHLRWPFRGRVTVVLLNQRGDGGKGWTIPIIGQISDQFGGRVVGQLALAVQGVGVGKAIAHADLGFNAEKSTEYLSNNCLKFQVSSVVLQNSAFPAYTGLCEKDLLS